MTIKVGSVYNVRFNSGNTHTAFSWPSKIPDSGNKYMKNKVIHITKKLNPKDSLDYDYVGDIYDSNDDAIELKNIKIVSKQLILKSSTFPVPGRKKASGKGKKSKKRTKKRTKKSKRKSKKYKRSSRKTRRSYIKKTRKRKMRGGAVMEWENYNTDEAQYSFENVRKTVTAIPGRMPSPDEILFNFEVIRHLGERNIPLGNFERSSYFFKKICEELSQIVDGLDCDDEHMTKGSIEDFLNNVLKPSSITDNTKRGRSIFLKRLYERNPYPTYQEEIAEEIAREKERTRSPGLLGKTLSRLARGGVGESP